MFLTSSNNNIPRIHLCLSNLRKAHGDLLLTIGGQEIHGYPSLETCGAITDQTWRDLGFGYRAKFFVKSCATLLSLESPLDRETLLPKIEGEVSERRE